MVQQSPETRPTSDRAKLRVVVARQCRRPDELTTDPLVKTSGETVIDEIPHQVAQVGEEAECQAKEAALARLAELEAWLKERT